MKVIAREAEIGLAEIVEEALDFITPNEGSRPAIEDPGRALQLYDAILDWKYPLPDRLRFEEAVLPSFVVVQSVHPKLSKLFQLISLKQVSAEILLSAVLHPFVKLPKEGFGRFDPKQRCYSHANRTMTAIWAFGALSILRTDYWLMHPISTCAFIVLNNLQHGSEEVETLVRAGQCLREMKSAFPLAADCLSTINGAFKSARLQVPAYAHRYFTEIRHQKEGLMNHATAAIMPIEDSESPTSTRHSMWGPSFQELLDELDGITLD